MYFLIMTWERFLDWSACRVEGSRVVNEGEYGSPLPEPYEEVLICCRHRWHRGDHEDHSFFPPVKFSGEQEVT